jgi:hypothetical protein
MDEDVAIRMETGTFQRQVEFEPGYNELHDPAGSGCAGMKIRFVLLGDYGATQFLFDTGWTPLGPVDEHLKDERSRWPISATTHESAVSRIYPLGMDVGYHWATPLHRDQEPMECEYTMTGECYYDGSSLAATDLAREFMIHGEKAVWKELEWRYNSQVEAMDL